jgi:hypothetical protein
MSALGHKRTLKHVRAMSASPPKADIHCNSQNIRFGPIANIGSVRLIRAAARASLVGRHFSAPWDKDTLG